MYKNKAEQAVAEKRMAKNAKIWGICSVTFILACGIASYVVFGLNGLL